MSLNKEENPNSFSKKIRSSLVLKLNLEMMWQLLSGFISINILIFLMGFFAILWRTEIGMQEMIEIIRGPRNIAYDLDKGYEVIRGEMDRGIVLPNSLQRHLPVEIEDAKRNFFISELEADVKFSERIGAINYAVGFSTNTSYYHVIYPVGMDFKEFITPLIILFVAEGIILVSNIGKGQRAIKKTLRPIAELTEAARSLNTAQTLDGENLRDLAGKISSIDANRLDRRISVDDSQNELKALASAINEMLNRINVSYQSQVRFVSDASHELRTPISVIRGYINLLDRWGKEDEKTLQESIDAIKGEIEGMQDLVEKLLFLARGDNETIHLRKEIFDSCEILDEIIRETEMIDKNHIFKVEIQRPAYVEADRQLFKQAIRILVDNSIKYTPPEKEIMLKIIKDQDKVHMIVQDRGIGIDSEDLPYIFDRFYRSDESRARKSGGSGLGLSIAKWIIEHHGAYFEIVSRVDIGTRITIVFNEVQKV